MEKEKPKSFVRSLSLLDATLLVTGSMIGSGIFIVSADIARNVGSAGYLLLVWFASGLLTLFAALSYGELAGMMPNAGGQYVYIREAYNKFTAFLYGWTVFTVIQTGVIAAVAMAFATFTAQLFPFFDKTNVLFSIGTYSFSTTQLLAIASIFFLTYINSKGISYGKLIQMVFTSAKLIALFGLIALGFFIGFNTEILSLNSIGFWEATQTTKSVTDVWSTTPLSGVSLLSALGVAMIGSLFSSDAWNNVTFISAEIKDPAKNLPRSLFLGTTIVTIIYILVNIVYLGIIPVKGVADGADVMSRGLQFATMDRVGTAVAEILLGSSASVVMAILIMMSTFGCNNGLILSGARVYYAMANDGLFFKNAGKLNSNGVPSNALYWQAVWASVLCLSGSYGALLDYTILAALAFYIITISGIFILRKKQPNTPRPYKAIGYPIIPIVYCVVAFLICINLIVCKPENALPCLAIVFAGIPVYFLYKKYNN